jgi:hypothetical protein
MGYSELGAAAGQKGVVPVRLGGRPATVADADHGTYPFWETEYGYTYGEPDASSPAASFLRYLTIQSRRDDHDLAAPAGAGLGQEVVVEPGADDGRVHDHGHGVAGAGRASAGQGAGPRGHEGRRVRVVEKPVRAAALGGPDVGHAQRRAAGSVGHLHSPTLRAR